MGTTGQKAENLAQPPMFFEPDAHSEALIKVATLYIDQNLA